jgi:hypothetical protein
LALRCLKLLHSAPKAYIPRWGPRVANGTPIFD